MGTSLADRIRDVLQTQTSKPAAVAQEVAGSGLAGDAGREACAPGHLERVLGGEWRQHGGIRYFVVESRRERSSVHGRRTVGALADLVEGSLEEAALVAGFSVAAPLLFFDLETTGLSGGAGTYPFLVGCAWFDDEGAFVTRQFVVVRFSDERSVLGAVAAELSRAGALVSFNGRSFDAPLLETRYLYHRLGWAGATLPHLDMLHVARRFWKRDDAAVESNCSLVALEHHLLGHRRQRDVPSFEIPARYFQFVRTGDARPLAAVFEHNRLDLLSLAALTGHVLHLVRTGPQGVRAAREALALGVIYARTGLEARSQEAYQRAIELSSAPSASPALSVIHIEALRALAVATRRARRYDAAAGYWRRMLDVGGCPPHVAREASEALAIHHEHRARDLVAARTFALQSLIEGSRPARNEAVRHRLARIERKMEKSEVWSLPEV